MTLEQQQLAIAEACGWSTKHKGLWVERLQTYAALPDYLNDLNAMHEVEKVLTVGQRVKYANQIGVVMTGGTVRRSIPNWWLIHEATASQRAEAFLRTIGKWEEAE